MYQFAWTEQELLPLTEAAQLLSGSISSRAALYARIRRGTLYAVRVGRQWRIPRVEVNRLLRQAKRAKPKRTLSLDLQDDLARISALSIPKRGRAALEAQAFLRGTIRARLRRMYPDLSAREITIKYWEEIARNA
ncbi:MAG TPA: helix-turn-helix domain-containing protein [Anaerolineae bacterium]|nr:helix-turn-helix domain-containing protein [Anaerolineae bacterium]